MIRRHLLAAASAAALLACLPFIPLPANAQGSDPAKLGSHGLARAQEVFSRKLVVALARKNKNQNIVVSPLGAASALAILAQGADQDMKATMRSALQIMEARALQPDPFAQLLGQLAGVAGAPVETPLILASQLVLDPAMEPNAETMAALRGKGVEVSEASLADPANITKINAWVEQKTRGLIPAIIDRPPGPGALVALNALYFRDKWQMPFDPAQTTPQAFASTDGKTDAVPLMAQSGTFRFRRDGERIAVELGFADPGFRLVIVTSTGKPEPAAALAENTHGWLGGNRFEDNAGTLIMPRLRVEGTNDLLEPLQALGMKGEANSLRGFGAKPPQISAIAQKAVLKLDEEGAEAAAATAAIATRSISTGDIRMVVDKPFLFALRDVSTGMFIISGYIARP